MKPGAMTTEFWITIATIGGILILAVTDHQDAIPWLFGGGATYTGLRTGLKALNGNNSTKEKSDGV